MRSDALNTLPCRVLFSLCLQILWFLAVPSSLPAQNATSGGLTGIVSDPSHALVPQATLVLRDNAKGNESGATNMLLGLNAVEEATIVSNGYSGRTGTLAGAEVNYVTRSGSDEFHGNAFYFWNGRMLNANDWFNNANGAPRPFDNANQWAASLGGPIRKDKFFSSWTQRAWIC